MRHMLLCVKRFGAFFVIQNQPNETYFSFYYLIAYAPLSIGHPGF